MTTDLLEASFELMRIALAIDGPDWHARALLRAFAVPQDGRRSGHLADLHIRHPTPARHADPWVRAIPCPMRSWCAPFPAAALKQ